MLETLKVHEANTDLSRLLARVEAGERFVAGGLPAIHRDPFDRLPVAQAQVQGILIPTSASTIAGREVDVTW